MAQNITINEAIKAVGDFCLGALRQDAKNQENIHLKYDARFTIDTFVSDAIGKYIMDEPDEASEEEEYENEGVQLTEPQQLIIEALERNFPNMAGGGIADNVKLRATNRFNKLFKNYKSGMENTMYDIGNRDVDRRFGGAKEMARLLSFMSKKNLFSFNSFTGVSELELTLQNGNQDPTETPLIESSETFLGSTKVKDGRPVIELRYLDEFDEVDINSGVRLMPLLVLNSGELHQHAARDADDRYMDRYMDRDAKVYKVLAQMERSEESMIKLTSRVKSNDWWLDENETPTIADMFQILYCDGVYIIALLLDAPSNRMVVESNVIEMLLLDATHLLTSSVEHKAGEEQLQTREYVDRMYTMMGALTQCCVISSELEDQWPGHILQEVDENTAKSYLIAIIKQVSNRNGFISNIRHLKSQYEDAEMLPRLFVNNDPLLVHILLLLATPANELNSVSEHYYDDEVEVEEAEITYFEDDAMQEHVKPRKFKGAKMLVNTLREVYKRNSNWTATMENYGVNIDGVKRIEKEVDLSNALMGANITYGTWAAMSKYRLNACLERIWGNILDGTASSKELPLGNREVYRNLNLYDFGFPITCHKFNDLETTELKNASFRQRYIAIAQDEEVKRKDQRRRGVDDDEETDVDEGDE